MIKVLSGSQLPKKSGDDKDVVDPFVVVSMYGYPDDEKNNNTLKTKVVEDNGFNPKWNE